MEHSSVKSIDVLEICQKCIKNIIPELNFTQFQLHVPDTFEYQGNIMRTEICVSFSYWKSPFLYLGDIGFSAIEKKTLKNSQQKCLCHFTQCLIPVNVPINVPINAPINVPINFTIKVPVKVLNAPVETDPCVRSKLPLLSSCSNSTGHFINFDHTNIFGYEIPKFLCQNEIILDYIWPPDSYLDPRFLFVWKKLF